jgi:Putative peptidoglycan binding domain/L,D-transpeptidase catalytic domain
VRKTTGVLTLVVTLAAAVLLAPAGSTAATHAARTGTTSVTGTAMTSGAATGVTAGSMTRRFAREPVRLGHRDRSPYDIEHVTELQRRLKRAGLFKVRPTGTYGTVTRSAVLAFQGRHGLRPTGRANRATWRVLLPRTSKNLGTAHRRCAGPGWHACYDRRNHQVTLWRSGRLWNSWLVRGGSASTKTRTGDFTVFRRDKDHISSLFGSPMPYSQFFSGGQALHGSRAMMDPYVGHSHGCINMYVEDARQLWRLTHDHRLRVHVFGRWS